MRTTPAYDDATLAMQVALDRAGFSVGVIDGAAGNNTRRAEAAYRDATGSAVDASATPALVDYTISEADVAGPFAGEIPEDMMAKAKLPGLYYSTPAEAIGERFHTSPEMLKTLNPSATFAAGETIRVPNVTPFEPPAAGAGTKVPAYEAGAGTKVPAYATGAGTEVPAYATNATNATISSVTVSKAASTAIARDAHGKVVFYAPVTSGSEHDPLPIGKWTVTAVVRNPTFNYNPDLFWDAEPGHSKTKIPAGPNGPVGVVWIDISKPHYGLHGTPEPKTIGHSQSHGCVRLTNWDAIRLAGLVTKGTPVIFTR